MPEHSNNQLYEIDYSAWLASQIEGLRTLAVSPFRASHNIELLDIPHLIEEIEGLNKSNERELESYLVVLLTHLLKWEFQPQMRCGSWSGSIKNSRKRIAKLFKQQRSLESRLGEFLSEAYADAVEWASEETGIAIRLFPRLCPYTPKQLKDIDWLPS